MSKETIISMITACKSWKIAKTGWSPARFYWKNGKIWVDSPSLLCAAPHPNQDIRSRADHVAEMIKEGFTVNFEF